MLSHHASTGRFIRLRRGLYRLRDYPSSPHEEVVASWLAVGKEHSVVSHESALALLGLSDVVPNAIHILAPRSRRGLRHDPLIALHTTTHPLQPGDVVIREGIHLTAPLRTILAIAAMGTASEQMIMAIHLPIPIGRVRKAVVCERLLARPRRVPADWWVLQWCISARPPLRHAGPSNQ